MYIAPRNYFNNSKITANLHQSLKTVGNKTADLVNNKSFHNGLSKESFFTTEKLPASASQKVGQPISARLLREIEVYVEQHPEEQFKRVMSGNILFEGIRYDIDIQGRLLKKVPFKPVVYA